MPGQIDAGNGYLFTGGHLDKYIHEIPIADVLRGKVGLPVTVENDAKCAGLAEEALDGRKAFALANEGNEAVLQVMRSHFRKLAIQIYNLQVIYDPEKIAIGGGISRQPLVLSMIQEGLDEIYEKRPLTVYPVNLVACEFRSDANLIGALHYHLENYRCEEREL
jgi:predicted NBD/HSP70 family sugar kinase